MSMDRIRIGIVGAGGIVRDRHMPGLRRIEGVEVTAVCNRSRASGERFAAEWGVPNVVEDWHEIVESPGIDAVLIGAWPSMHCPVSLAALAAGKHVFCQARMAMDAREAKLMAEAAENARRGKGLVTMICPAPTGIWGDRLMRKLLADGYVGRIHAIHVRVLKDNWADPAAPFHWRLDSELSGVNTLAVGLYVEWVHRWFGATRRIGAQIATTIPVRRDPATGRERKVVYPDVILVNGQMASGALVSYEFSGVHRAAQESDTIEVYGSDGTLKYIVGGERDTIVGARNGESLSPIPMPDELVRLWDVEVDWIEAIRTGGPTSPSFAEGLTYMDVTEAIYHSASAGRMIDLPLSDELRNAKVFPPSR